MSAVIDRIFFEHGMRFVFSTRSKVPYILKEGSKTERFFDPATGYRFQPGVDEVVREGKDGYIVTFGEMVRSVLLALCRPFAHATHSSTDASTLSTGSTPRAVRAGRLRLIDATDEGAHRRTPRWPHQQGLPQPHR
jgi:hypothetical protein